MQRRYDLEERTTVFANQVRAVVRRIPKTAANLEDGKQLIRSSGSVAANYTEANDALGKGDFMMRIKICRKESKESRLWLRLLYLEKQSALDGERQALIQEAGELVAIFSAILNKMKKS